MKKLHNTEGLNKLTETDLINISGDIWQKMVKISKNTEGYKNKKAVLTTTKKIKCCLYDDKKNKKLKKKGISEQISL